MSVAELTALLGTEDGPDKMVQAVGKLPNSEASAIVTTLSQKINPTANVSSKMELDEVKRIHGAEIMQLEAQIQEE